MAIILVSGEPDPWAHATRRSGYETSSHAHTPAHRSLIAEAVRDQRGASASGKKYQADNWWPCRIYPPHFLAAGLNDPNATTVTSRYFFDERLLNFDVADRWADEREILWQTLQVQKSRRTNTYRAHVGIFELKGMIECVCGWTLNNGHAGGGANKHRDAPVQFFLPRNPPIVLKRVVELGDYESRWARGDFGIYS